MKAAHGASPAALALEYLILTAVRSGEVRGATWDEVDLDAAVWTIPAERMKAGKAHRVPLSGRALEILRDAEQHRGTSDLLFPGRGGRPMTGKALLALLDGGGASVHGFRSSFRDWAAERSNAPREIAEMALAHVEGSAVESAPIGERTCSRNAGS